MKLIHRHKNPLLAFIAFLMISGCTQGSSAPKFTSGDETAPSYDVSVEGEPAVNEELAKEAGILHLIYHIGPVDLPANTELDVMLDRPLTMNFQVDEPLWIMGVKPKVIDMSGEELPSTLLHHAIISNAHEENPLCTEGTVGNPFIAASSTLTKVSLPDGYGYAVLPTDPLEAKVVLYNPTQENYVDVSLELSVVAKPMNEFSSMKDVKPLMLDLDACSHEPMKVEPEQFVRRQATYSLPSGGNLIVGHAVLQNYASFLELYRGKDVMPFWRAETVLDEDHNVLNLDNDPFEDPAGVKFKKGDTITLSVAYDNTQTNWIKGATSAAMIYYVMDEE